MQSSLGNSTTKGVKWTGLSSVVNAAVKLIQVSILAHLLSPDAFGLIAIAYIFLTFGDIIVDMGLTTAIFHFRNITAKQYSSLFWINIALGGLTSGLIFLASGSISDYYQNPDVKGVVEWLSLNTFVISISRLHRTFLQKNLLFKKMSQIEIYGALFMCIASVALALGGLGVYSLVFGTLASSVFITVLLLINVPQLNRRLRFYISVKSLKPFYAIGSFQFMSSIIEFFSREMDTMFISTYFSIELLGYYSLCKQLAQRLYTVINPIILKVAVPTLSLLQDNVRALTDSFVKMLSIASAINFPIYALLAILSKPLLFYLYGPSYIAQSNLLIIFAAYYSILSVGSFTGVLTVSLGNTKVGLAWSMYRVTSMAIICFLSRNLPFLWFVFMMTLGITLLNFYIGYRMTVKRFIPLTFQTYIGAQFPPCVISTVITLVCYRLWQSDMNMIVTGIISSFLFLILYLLMSYFFNPSTSRYVFNKLKRG